MSKKYEFEKVLVLSTGHMLKSDSELLDKEDRPSLVAYPYDYGHYIWVGIDDDSFENNFEGAIADGFSEAFLNLLRLAHRMNCPYLKLDCDGPIMDDLPKFDW